MKPFDWSHTNHYRHCRKWHHNGPIRIWGPEVSTSFPRRLQINDNFSCFVILLISVSIFFGGKSRSTEINMLFCRVNVASLDSRVISCPILTYTVLVSKPFLTTWKSIFPQEIYNQTDESAPDHKKLHSTSFQTYKDEVLLVKDHLHDRDSAFIIRWENEREIY
jgi:hypothetical protein